MSTQYRLVQSGKTASGGAQPAQGSSEPVAPWKKKLFVSLFKVYLITLSQYLRLYSVE
jgi:hypothetical protein